MVEVYAFLAAFAVQILAMSVLGPAWFLRYVRVQATNIPSERFAQLYPGVDFSRRAQERFFTRYRALQIGIAALGLLLLGWLFSYMRRPDWDDGPVEALVSAYFFMQVLPLVLMTLGGLVFKNKVLKHSAPEGKRKATLQRRGLFDFISPIVVSVAGLGYFLFVAFAIHIKGNAELAGALTSIGGITLVYALNAFVVYKMLYGRKINPLETHPGHLRTMRLAVKSGVYSCIACVVFVSLNFTLVRLDLQRWEPFALSVFFVITTFLCLMGLTAPRKPEGDGLGADGQLTPETRDLST
jgi:hypothetical protein